jgi:hypothetical protein
MIKFPDGYGNTRKERIEAVPDTGMTVPAMDQYDRDPAFGAFFHVQCDPVNRYAPLGTRISKRAPFPKVPVSLMVIPVRERISRDRYMSSPTFRKKR